jgi:hypothetical protein
MMNDRSVKQGLLEDRNELGVGKAKGAVKGSAYD